MNKLKMLALVSLIMGSVASVATAQTPRMASYNGSTWGFYLLETGAGMTTVLTGQPSLSEGHPEAIITVVSRDGHAITEADRNLAVGLARGLCEQTGRQFNTQTRGHWLHSGGLGFGGACSQW
ncbi:hypothetical protein [Pararhodobacter sp.]|uniref:hypothetical protein n=1 Tax=Pararhodobacter sp. TaxID=2127056 RepID=UPI002AFF9095|nr:hypothetical protein [Pararhodobacter sp.]